MNKNLYEILGIDKTATPEQIKKSYQKLALKWHPDKWNSNSLEERKKSNEKMQELNKAYEILSDEDKRKKYDLGETNFTPEFDWDDYYEAEKARLDAEEARLDAERERIWLDLKIIAYWGIENVIGFEMNLENVYGEDLDSSLWAPYSCWEEKLRSLEVIVDEKGIDKVNSSAYKFKEEILTAIKKRREELDNGINDPYLDEAKNIAIEVIESNLSRKNLKVEDLDEKYRNYRKHINDLIKVWKIRDFRDEVIENIRIKSRRINWEKQNSYIDQPPKNGWFWFFRGSGSNSN